MKTRVIKDQKEFDTIKRVEADEEIIFESEEIEINCRLEVFGILRLTGKIKSSGNIQCIVGRGSSQIHNVGRESSQIHNEGWESSQIHNVGRGSSQIHNEGWESSQIHNVGQESSQIHNVGWGSSQIHNVGNCTSLSLYNFSVASIPLNLKLKIKKSKTAIVQRYKPIISWFNRNGISKTNKVILYKKVSKDWKTQENTPNETLWTIGSVVEHPTWNPENSECGEGKFHACSRPYFCDEFRNMIDDRYIAVQINRGDLFEWKNHPSYPHKIGFRKGTVLYDCDRYGEKIEAKE